MLKDITLGQFFPGKTLIHRVDPRFKIVITAIFICTVFFANSFLSYFLVFVFLGFLICISKIKVSLFFKGLKPLIFIIILTAALNIFTVKGEILFEWWILKATKEGIFLAVFMVSRIMLLIFASSLLTYTTSPIALTDAIERLFNPLKKLKVPVHELAMMMTIALRFIPILIEETDKIMNAQRARGADFESGNVFKRA